MFKIKLAIRFHAFPEIPEMLKIHAHKKLNFQHYRENLNVANYSNIVKPQNAVFMLSHKIKMSQST